MAFFIKSDHASSKEKISYHKQTVHQRQCSNAAQLHENDVWEGL